MHRRLASMFAATALFISASAHAGQVRVDVGNFQFTPAAVTVNLGDQVVWVWTGGVHSATSGTDGSETGDGIFNSDVNSTGANGSNAAFTWQTDRTGAIPYYCIPHFPDMAGTITVQPGSTAPVSDFRITEVLYNAGGGPDLIEITNMGTASGNLGRYRLAIPGDVEGLPIASITVGVNGIVVIRPAASGTNSTTNVFVPQLTALPDAAGSVALYTPNTINGQTGLTDPSQIVDFVQYGAGGQANEATAVTAGLWTAGQSVPTVGIANRSIEFCGNRSDHGAAQWSEIDPTNFGSDGNCVTPVAPSTWGRVKTLYR